MAIAVDSEGGRSRERNGEGQAGSQAGGDGEPANPSPAGRPLALPGEPLQLSSFRFARAC